MIPLKLLPVLNKPGFRLLIVNLLNQDLLIDRDFRSHHETLPEGHANQLHPNRAGGNRR